MPPPPPPKQGVSMFTVILLLALVTVGVAWYRGWLTVDKDPVTNKTTIGAHSDKFKADKDAFLKTTGETVVKLKDKLTGKDAPPLTE